MQITFDLTNAQHRDYVSRILWALTPPQWAASAAQAEARTEAARPAAQADVPVVSAELPESLRAEAQAVAAANAEPVKRGRGRPRKAPTHAELASTVGPDVEPEAEPEPAKPLTVDDVRAALQGFTAAKGVPAGLALLKTFGASRISELKAEDYAAFVKGCAA